MYHALPHNHGLSDEVEASPLVRRDEATGAPSLTHAQYEGLAYGVARGESMLLVAPTSSGKTEVGLIAIASWLRADRNYTRKTVYLVSHRALARQKHKDLLKPEMLAAFGIEPADMVMSNGDLTVDGNGAVPESPLNARVLIATYEKFLALLANSGHQPDMTHYCVVADECQLIGDNHRGREVEILLTLIKQANCGQFVGLSAVLSELDVNHLSTWMGIAPVVVDTREVPLAYELRTTTGKYIWRTDGPEQVVNTGEALPRSTLDILAELSQDPASNLPVAVFCMSKPRVKALAEGWAQRRGVVPVEEAITRDLFGETTSLGENLAAFLPHNFAMHTTDLIDAERALVEDRLENNQIAVVFATSTLAQGLNFPFKTVVFDHWARWDSGQGARVPITRSELRNMAGRAGRLGMGDAEGRVILTAQQGFPENFPTQYLGNSLDDLITPRLVPEWFDLIALQLLASRIATNMNELLAFMDASLSGYLLRDNTQNFDAYLRNHLTEALTKLTQWGYVLGADALTVTDLGQAVARSGLQPKSANFFQNYLTQYRDHLLGLLPPSVPLEGLEQQQENPDWSVQDSDLVFLLSHLIATSPEYEDRDTTRRFLPYPLEVWRESNRAIRHQAILSIQPWDAGITAVNASDIVADWVQGGSMRDFELSFGDDRRPLTGGQITGVLRDLAAFMSGLGDILEALTATTNAHLPTILPLVPTDGIRRELRRLLRRIRQLARQITVGIPEDVLWMLELDNANGEPLLKRSEILALYQHGITSLEDLLGAGKVADFNEAMTEVNVPQEKRATIREAARASRVKRTDQIKGRLLKDLGPIQCQGLINTYFTSRGTVFEDAVASCLDCVEITILERDGDDQLRFPDFVVDIIENSPVVIESKSKEGDREVPLGEATDVGGKAAAHGLNRHPMVTICQPYVATDVPGKIKRAQDLSVVNAEDFAQVLAALKLGRITKERFYDWITTPGQPRFDDLFRP